MHARRSARNTYRWPDRFFLPGGDISFASPIDAQEFCEAYARHGGTLTTAEAIAMSLLHEVLHRVVERYRQERPDSFGKLLEGLRSRQGHAFDDTLRAFARTFPPPTIYRGDETVEQHFAARGERATLWATEEVVLLWLINQNPAYDPVRPIVTDSGLPPSYVEVIDLAREFFAGDGPFGPRGETLFDLLQSPSRHAPHSIFAQLAYVATFWAERFGLDALGLLERLGVPLALDRERHRWQAKGTGPGAPQLEPLRFSGPAYTEEMRFSPDTDWMPRVVLLAKSVYVWLDQLARRYGREIRRLDQVPDEELAWLSRAGFSGLWLIGVFERSRASRKIKRMQGDHEALASAYALRSYDIASELGGEEAWRGLSERAGKHGIRLAADMVPNHVAIDADWVVRHPEWFVQTSVPPFPNYRYTGEDLSEDERVGVQIEDGYWSHTDAAVVFKRRDRWSGAETFIYHGNDGTSMPWNDTAQLDYTKPEVRHAVIQTILHVARRFPIIRFDAAMTLAKRHYQRLWFPLPGHDCDIPTRAAFAMPQEELDRRMPQEFWREVVDTVAREAPDTLLLAEAFWLMEGYFVRTLGMHRVYNSAFMNMLKREENAKYRETIRNVLEFDARILERFVNFMSNPDEETAIAQFGDGDKYFGVCVLMCTMPGLPMFGHGQVEGLHEKYGMEYARAKWDETPIDWMISRHEREIFPLMRRRHVFSGVTNFSLYDFATEHGVNQDVYAYSNRAGDDRAVVLFHNKWGETRGWIHGSVPARGADGQLHGRTLAEALGLPPGGDGFVRYRDLTGDLEYLRPLGELRSQGLRADLRAFEYHVFADFRVVQDAATAPWGALAGELEGRGVPSLDRALAALRYRPLHEALRAAVAAGAAPIDAGPTAPASKSEARVAGARLQTPSDEPGALAPSRRRRAPGAEPAAGTERVAAVVKSLAEALGTILDREGRPRPPSGPAIARATRLAGELARGAVRPPRPAAGYSEPGAGESTLWAWIALDATVTLLAAVDPRAKSGEWVDALALDEPLIDAIRQAGVPADVAEAEAAAIIVLTTLPEGLDKALAAVLDDPRGRRLLHIHTADGVEWLNQERWDELTRLLARRDHALAGSQADARELSALATRAGFKTAGLRAAIAKRRVPAGNR